jgi:hypothetical protein
MIFYGKCYISSTPEHHPILEKGYMIDLLHAADKYALEKLKVMCQDILFLKLRPDNNVTG